MANLLSTTITGNLTVDTNILYVDSTNNRVGIGTTSPSNDILHVAGNIMMDGSILRMASSTTKLVLQNVGGSWNSLSAKGINIGDWNSDPSYGDILVGNYDFSIKNDALTSLVKVKNNGNVLIGTTTDSGYKLDVIGTLRATTLYGNGSNLTNISSAATLTTARTLTIGNSAKSFNGSANVSWSLTEIQADYRVPYNTLRNNLGDPTSREAALFHGQFNNKFRFLAPTLQEESTDGTNWTTSTRATAAQLGDLMIGEGQGTSFAAIPTGTVGTYGGYRLTWDVVGSTGYVFLNEVYIYNSTNGNAINVTIEKYHNTNGWQVVCGPLSGNNWPGHFYIPHTTITYSNSATQHSKVRITFESTHASYTNDFRLYAIEWFGGYPQGRRNPEYYDRDKNVTFPAQISALGSVNLGTGGSGSLQLNGVSVLSRTGTYTQVSNPEGAITLYLGDSADRTNYYDNNTHTFRNAGGGSTYAVINSVGNVGIGTSSPSYKLDVVGEGKVTGKFRVGGAVMLAEPGTGVLLFGSEGGSQTAIYSASLERIRINSSGNVGIGITTPNHKVDIYSNENVPLRIHRPSNANLDSSGAWGIGFSTRGDAINSTTDTRAGIFSYYNGNLFLAAANTSIVADPDTYARLTVLNTGNVGIGTTAPGQKLHVVGNIYSTGITYGDSHSAFTEFRMRNNENNVLRRNGSTLQLNSTDDLVFSNTASFVEAMRIKSSGNVGIGTTSPAQKLDISQGSIFLSGAGSKYLYIRRYDGLGTHSFGVGSDEKLILSLSGGNPFIVDGGNVGIGTTGPDSRLQVLGSVKIGGSATNTYSLRFQRENTAVPQDSHFYSPSNNSPSAFFIEGGYWTGEAAGQVTAANSGYAYYERYFGNGTTSSFKHLGFVNKSASSFISTDLVPSIAMTSNGNVGIGTTGPSALFHVNKGTVGEVARLGAGNYQLTFGVTTTYGEIQAVEQGVAYRNLSLNRSGGNVLIGTSTDNGKRLQVSGDVFIKGSGSASSTKIFEVQNSNGTSIMDFRGDAYAFFGCGQGGGSASGFIFRYNDTAHVQFTGYNYGNGSGSYKPILLDTDLVGRGQGIYVNFGGTGYANPAPLSTTEFAVRGRTSDATQNVMELRDSNNTEKFVVKNDGSIVTDGSTGWTGTVGIPNNPPGSQNLEFKNGILINVF